MEIRNKSRKSPLISATKFNLGVKKEANDGNMWKIVQNKNGTKRWLKISPQNKTKRFANLSSDETMQDNDVIRAQNKRLYKFWVGLADTKQSVFIFKDKSHKIFRTNIKKEQEDAATDDNVVAILDSGPSFDAYRELYRKVGNKSVEEVIQNYKKYFNEGASGKRLFC